MLRKIYLGKQQVLTQVKTMNSAIFAKIRGKIDKITAMQNVNVLLFCFLKIK